MYCTIDAIRLIGNTYVVLLCVQGTGRIEIKMDLVLEFEPRVAHLDQRSWTNFILSQYDGEFWMEFFTDFCREFEEVSICTLGPDFNHDGVVEAAEAVKVTFGEWLPGTE